MKKIISAMMLALCLMLACACALGEITVTKRDMALNRNLDRSVSNVLVLLQNQGVTDTMLLASINSKTGRSVMTQIDCARVVNVPEVGDVTLGEVYELGAQRSKGFVAARTLNQMLDLNISTYVAMDMAKFPELVDEIEMLSIWLNEEEAAILNTWAGDNALTSANVLDYVNIRLESDYAEKNRCYTVFMSLLKQGLRSTNAGDMMSMGKKLLASMDTNMNVMAAVTMLSSFQAGDDRRELLLPAELSEEEMRAALYREVYE